MNSEALVTLRGMQLEFDKREHEWRTWASDWYPVRLNYTFVPGYEPLVCAWLQQHAGDRYHAWMLPQLDLIVFKDADVAVQFALLFT